jgi:hypothetical protein
MIVSDNSSFQVETAFTKLGYYKSPYSHKIPAEVIHARDEILLSEIHNLINSIWEKEELPDH